MALGLILAGRDLMAVDAIASRIMGFQPDEVPITKAAALRGLGPRHDAGAGRDAGESS